MLCLILTCGGHAIRSNTGGAGSFSPHHLLPGPPAFVRVSRGSAMGSGISRSIASPRCAVGYIFWLHTRRPGTRPGCVRDCLCMLCVVLLRGGPAAPLLACPPRPAFPFVAHGGQSHSESDSRQIEIEIGTPPFCSFPSFLSVEPVCETESCVFF